MTDQAVLALEDGSVFRGRSIGAAGETTGEVVFNTAMTGYQEILTDPSYHFQMVVMTYPLIGNYGVNPKDFESRRIYAAGFIIREYSPIVSHWQANRSLDEYLKFHGVVGISDIDTRALTRHLRDHGAQKQPNNACRNHTTQGAQQNDRHRGVNPAAQQDRLEHIVRRATHQHINRPDRIAGSGSITNHPQIGDHRQRY